MAWTTPATIVGGQTAGLSTAFNTNAADLAVIGGSWTTDARASTAIWTTASAVLGNGTLVSRYRAVGKTVDWLLLLTLGSTTVPGVGAQFAFAYPSGVPLNSPVPVPIYINDTSATTTYTAMGVTTGSTVNMRIITAAAGSTGLVTNTTPMTWATGDVLSFQMSYETA